MINRGFLILFWSFSLFGAFAYGPTAAHAELDAGGGIFLSADGGCEYRPKKDAPLSRTPSNVHVHVHVNVYDQDNDTERRSSS
jgi:hypothetical protein